MNLEEKLEVANATIAERDARINSIMAQNIADTEKLKSDYEQIVHNLNKRIEDMLQRMAEADQFSKDKEKMLADIKHLREEVER